MPGDKPELDSGANRRVDDAVEMNGVNLKSDTGFGLAVLAGSLSSRSILSLFTILMIFWVFSTEAFAQDGELDFFDRLIISFKSTEILMAAVFGGAMSFALLSANWMIRERASLVAENQKLKTNLSELRATNDRNEALVNIPEQRIVVWNGTEERPDVLGVLSSLSGAPENQSQFLSFGAWLDGESSRLLEPALRELRTEAKPFELVLLSKGGGVIEAQGRTSGAYAFVRFRELGSERENHAKLKTKFNDLSEAFDATQNLISKMPMPAWLRDNDDRLIWTNQAYADAVEMQSPENVVKSSAELLDYEHHTKVSQGCREDGYYSTELPITVAGDRRKFEVFCAGNGKRMAGIALDRSDLDQVKKRLKETNEGHSRMLDHLATAVAIFDKTQNLTFFNPGFRQLWKLDTAFLESRPTNSEILDAMRDQKLLPEHPDWRKWRDGQLEVYTALEPTEEWWHLLDGQTIRVVTSPRNEGGAAWIFENVTERLALESNYNSLMRVQGETLDHLNEAVAVFGPDGKLRLFNPALESLWQATGLQVDEGIHITKIIETWGATIQNNDELQNIVGKVTGFDDERGDYYGRLELFNGSSFDYVLVHLPEGQSMLTLSDVTANVNFEKALQERAEALEASDQLKSKFIQHVSYELRAPLTNISGFGEMLASTEIGAMNQKQSEYLDHINTSASELRAIVDDILDLASIDAGTMVLSIEALQLEDTVRGIIEEFQMLMDEKGLQNRIEIDGDSKTILADRQRLAQILRNLVSNAIDFSPDGGVITILGSRKEDAYEIRIADQGPGVDDEQLGRIFDRFEARAVDGSRRGTGLGLSIVRSFVELHGGSVSVEETGERGGACFVCRLPLSPDTTPENITAGGSVHKAA
ncbi:MAG: ATP-binding protein [Pseudomonadota bacterium]